MRTLFLVMVPHVVRHRRVPSPRPAHQLVRGPAHRSRSHRRVWQERDIGPRRHGTASEPCTRQTVHRPTGGFHCRAPAVRTTVRAPAVRTVIHRDTGRGHGQVQSYLLP